MESLLRRLWRILNLRAAQRFKTVEERWGRSAAVGAMMLTGAYIGVSTVWTSYGLLLLWAWLQTRKQDPILVVMFLMGWFLIGAVQGAWLGSAIGYATAMRLLQRTRAARLACFINSLLFLTLILTLLYNYIPAGERLFALSLIAGAPTLTAIVMLAWSSVSLRRD